MPVAEPKSMNQGLNGFDVGVIKVSGNQIQWQISNFFDLLQMVDTEIMRTMRSPDFQHAGKKLFLAIWPNDSKDELSEEWFGMYLYPADYYTFFKKKFKKFQVRVDVTDSRRNNLHSSYLKWNNVFNTFEDLNFMSQSEVESQRSSMASDGYIRVICTFTEEPACRQKVEERAHDKLIQSYKELYTGRKGYDVKIRVKDREFRAYRGILRARTPVFDAMLSHDMVERNGGVISVEDCDPEVFEHFMLFLYTGKVENLSGSKACGLYQLGDKYDLPELREMCVQFLKGSLSKETICDVICLASNHQEVELLKLATQLLARKTEEILVSINWRLFMMENPVQASELTLKALKLGYKRRRIVCSEV